MPLRFTLEFHEDGTATYEVVEINKGKKNNPVAEYTLSAQESRRVVDAMQTAIGAVNTMRLTDPDYLRREFDKTMPTGGKPRDSAE